LKRELLCLTLTSLLHAAGMSPADRAVTAAFRRAASTLKDVALIERLPANEQLDLVLTLGSPQKAGLMPSGEYRWSTQDRIGLFLQDKADAGRIFQLAVEPGPNDDCFTRVERMTAQELVLSCTGEKSEAYDNQKFLYDIHAKMLVKRFSYAPFSADRVLGNQFLMSDKQRDLLVEVDSSTGAPRIVPDSEAHGVSPASAPDPAFDFGPGKRFRLVWATNKDGFKAPTVMERSGSQQQPYPLPQSDLNAWREARPDDAKTFLRTDAAEITEDIGPYQLEGDRLWFGKTFYNSEGSTGVGGFGYFDSVARAYKLYSPAEIRNWAVSAILVEPDSIWLALYRRGEYGNTPGGLLQWDRQMEHVRLFDLQSVVTHMARASGTLAMGAVDGILVLKDGRIQSYFVDRTSDGRYRMAEREGVPQ
jgi:hypothetical protein